MKKNTFNLSLGFRGPLDSSLTALCGKQFSPQHRPEERSMISCDLRSFENVLEVLETDEIDIGVVSLEDLISHTSSVKETEFRILGCLLGGDTRALACLSQFQKSAYERQTLALAAVDPERAQSFWEELSCAFDLDSETISAKHVRACDLLREVSSGRFNFSELNLHWEALFGLRNGFISETMRSTDFGVPSSFSHLLVAKIDFIERNTVLLQSLRNQIEGVYQEILTQSFSIAERLSKAGIFQGSPDAGFLSASFRVLAPHFEGFLRSKGALVWADLLPYACWFQRRFSHKLRENKLPYTAMHLEWLLCDSWS